MSIGRICLREIHVADATESVVDAACRMRDRGVGTLVVVDRDGRPAGMVTDRDLAIRVVAAERSPHTVTVRDVMTTQLKTVYESAPLESALATMRSTGCRRLPVVDDQGLLVGIVSVDDVLGVLAEELQSIGGLVAQARPHWASA
jgi:CBS domain-containing protein